MIRAVVLHWRLFIKALIDPAGAAKAAGESANFLVASLALLGTMMALGAATLPRQLMVLGRALGVTGNASQDLHYRLMESGLTRLIVIERLVPSPILILAAVGVVVLADPLLALARDQRPKLRTLVVIGLAPLLVQAVGELVVAYTSSLAARPTPGDAIAMANSFDTGPLLFWRRGGTAPQWLVILDARLNLISIWCVALWVAGLRLLDGGTTRAWHLAVPVVSLCLSGVATWVLGPVVFAALLGRP